MLILRNFITYNRGAVQISLLCSYFTIFFTRAQSRYQFHVIGKSTVKFRLQKHGNINIHVLFTVGLMSQENDQC